MKRNQNQMLDGSNGKDSNGQWLSRLKSWVSTSEPSMQALRQHKKLVCEKAANDPQASAKLHLSVSASTIPDEATRPAAGPDPDKVARKRAEERRLKRKGRPDHLLSSSGLRSARSHSMSLSTASSREPQS